MENTISELEKKHLLCYSNKCIVVCFDIGITQDMDRHTAEQRHKNMQAIKNKDSKIELALRKELWRRGLRYRKNVNNVDGHPDIAFLTKKIAVFVDSEFWHGFSWEERKKDFKSHQEFWISKIERNMQRDIEVNQLLRGKGWTVLRFWGKDIKENVCGCADIVEKAVRESVGARKEY